jgi:hypothetical protein
MIVVYSDIFLFHVLDGEEAERRRPEVSSDNRKCCKMENLFNRMNVRYIRNGENRRFYVVVEVESERATARIILIVYAYVSPSILCTILKEKKERKDFK